MLLQNWDAVPIQKLASGIERQMIVGEKMMICRLRFVPHTPTTAHDHPHEQMTFVEKGRLKFLIGEEEFIAQTGDILHIPSGSWHGSTILDEEVILVDLFSPIREDFL
jgi:quercetin dioxygenase-like cupin family protein